MRDGVTVQREGLGVEHRAVANPVVGSAAAEAADQADHPAGVGLGLPVTSQGLPEVPP